ncbi:trem-like transcript 4 protein isoform 3-T3 [Trichechus inunguis]
MAWEATYLLAPVLLVLRVSDSQEQETAPVLLQKLEGETISLICWYQFQKDSNKLKIWCKKMSENSCIPLVTSSRSQVQKSRYSIQDERSSGYFIINMTGLRTADSGFYYCGNYNSFSSVVHILRSFHLVVSQGNVVILRVLPPKTGLEVGSLGLWSKQMGVLPSLLSLLQLQPRSPQGALQLEVHPSGRGGGGPAAVGAHCLHDPVPQESPRRSRKRNWSLLITCPKYVSRSLAILACTFINHIIQ